MSLVKKCTALAKAYHARPAKSMTDEEFAAEHNAWITADVLNAAKKGYFSLTLDGTKFGAHYPNGNVDMFIVVLVVKLAKAQGFEVDCRDTPHKDLKSVTIHWPKDDPIGVVASAPDTKTPEK